MGSEKTAVVDIRDRNIKIEIRMTNSRLRLVELEGGKKCLYMTSEQMKLYRKNKPLIDSYISRWCDFISLPDILKYENFYTPNYIITMIATKLDITVRPARTFFEVLVSNEFNRRHRFDVDGYDEFYSITVWATHDWEMEINLPCEVGDLFAEHYNEIKSLAIGYVCEADHLSKDQSESQGFFNKYCHAVSKFLDCDAEDCATLCMDIANGYREYFRRIK